MFLDPKNPSWPHLNRHMGDQALEFLYGRPDGRPWCLSISFKAPHHQDEWPDNQYPYEKELSTLYRDATIPPPPLSDPTFFEALPEFLRTSESRIRWARRFTPEKYQESVKAYYRLITGVDAAVGRILEKLRAQNAEQNTVIVFTSDNGGEKFSSMGGLEGMKLQLWEGGIRVPAFVRWPGVVPAGRTTDQVATTLDWTATMLAAAGVATGPELDGMDLMPHLRDSSGPAERTVFWRSTRWGLQHAARQGNWKYLRIDKLQARSTRPETGELLFDLGRDPQERENLAGSQPEILEKLRRLYTEWEAGMLPPIEPVTTASRSQK